ncbi:hypothetical protein [Azospirillum brasilense]|uniref:hypothetical protein n=1 Tax=Azospirillum brasilense TaxID=192 RepID=UPI0030B8EB01
MFDQYPNQSRWGAGAAGVDRAAFDEGLRKHMLRVYNFMMLGLGVTGLVALFVASTPALYVPIFTTPLKWRCSWRARRRCTFRSSRPR